MVIASNGQEGLELYRETGGDLVVSDSTMPGMRGEEMLAEIRKINPDVFTALVSGDVDLEERMESLLKGGINVVLKKPINVEKLKEVLQQEREWKKEREKLKLPQPGLLLQGEGEKA